MIDVTRYPVEITRDELSAIIGVYADTFAAVGGDKALDRLVELVAIRREMKVAE